MVDSLKFFNRLRTASLRLEREWRIWNTNRQVALHQNDRPGERPVVLFNTSSRLGGFSQNAAFTLLTGWGLQLAGIPIVYYACRSGMSRCVLGTYPDDPGQKPPCSACISQTKKLTAPSRMHWFDYQSKPALEQALEGLTLKELCSFEFHLNKGPNMTDSPKVADSLSDMQNASNLQLPLIPLGRLVLPSLRWVMRRHHLVDNQSTRYLIREFIKSAYRVAEGFSDLLLDKKPQAVVVFNGLQFPEATARWISHQYGIRVISHEVGFQPFSAFFSDGPVTAYPFEIPDDFELSPEQHSQIETLLSRRFQGEFTMAGITFWPEMTGLDEKFLQFVGEFDQIVPVFTNVIFDTSQVHANTVFPDMFAWLDQLLDVIRRYPKTLFVIRAHPDEMRAGKQSRESVQQWITRHQVDKLRNVIFVASDVALSSYDLIQRSKFVIVYNSSIGLEAALLGVPVLCGGKARYTQYPTVFLPKTLGEYHKTLERFLLDDNIVIPPEFERNARRVLYHQFFRSSLLLGDYLKAHPTPGYVQLRRFSWRKLLPENSPVLSVIVDGILNGKPFLMPE